MRFGSSTRENGHVKQCCERKRSTAQFARGRNGSSCMGGRNQAGLRLSSHLCRTRVGRRNRNRRGWRHLESAAVTPAATNSIRLRLHPSHRDRRSMRRSSSRGMSSQIAIVPCFIPFRRSMRRSSSRGMSSHSGILRFALRYRPKSRPSTKRDEARYDSGARIEGYRNGKAKVKPRACIGAARCRCPPPAAAAAARCRTV
jgi:hypothetical protein